MYSEIAVDRLNEVALQYRPIIAQAIKEALNQPKFRNTGAGADSVKVTITEGTKDKAPVITIEFDEHVKFFDSRTKLQWTKQPNMRELLAWAETKTNEPKEAKRLAWGTAWKQKNFDAWKPKRWRKKNLGEVLKELNAEVIKAFDRAVEEDFQEAANV